MVGVRVLVHLRVEREQRPRAGDVDVVSVRHLDHGEPSAGGGDVHGAGAFRELRKDKNDDKNVHQTTADVVYNRMSRIYLTNAKPKVFFIYLFFFIIIIAKKQNCMAIYYFILFIFGTHISNVILPFQKKKQS